MLLDDKLNSYRAFIAAGKDGGYGGKRGEGGFRASQRC